MKNKIKTLLIASLIAAMILPFSMVNYTVAEARTDDDATKMTEYKNELKSQRDKKTTDESEKQEIETAITRVNIMLELLQVKEDLQTGTISQEFADNSTKTMLEELDNVFDDAVSLTTESVNSNTNTARTGTINFQTSTQTKFNCDTISTQTGYNWGTVTGIDFIESYVVGVQGYPSSIAVMENNYCVVKNFDDGYVKYRNIATGKMCTGPLNNANSVAQGYCAKFGSGAPILISSYALYEGSTPFNIAEGWVIKWVP